MPENFNDLVGAAIFFTACGLVGIAIAMLFIALLS